MIVKFGPESVYAAFQFSAVVDVDVTYLCAFAFKYFDDGVEKFVYSFTVSASCMNDGHSKQCGKLFYIEIITAFFQFVVHIECHYYGNIHVNELSGEVKVAFQVASVNDIQDDVGHLFDEMFADV